MGIGVRGSLLVGGIGMGVRSEMGWGGGGGRE